MLGHRVSFFKNILSSDGHQFRCLQEEFNVPNAENADQAAESAVRQFEKLHGLNHWKMFADTLVVESMEIR